LVKHQGEVAVPDEGDGLGVEHLVAQWDEAKVDHLGGGPEHIVPGHDGGIGFVEALADPIGWLTIDQQHQEGRGQ